MQTVKESFTKRNGYSGKVQGRIGFTEGNFCSLLQTADDGNVAKYLRSNGFQFEDSSSTTPSIEEEKIIKEQPIKKEKRKHPGNSGGFGFIIIISLAALGLLLALLFKKHH